MDQKQPEDSEPSPPRKVDEQPENEPEVQRRLVRSRQRAASAGAGYEQQVEELKNFASMKIEDPPQVSVQPKLPVWARVKEDFHKNREPYPKRKLGRNRTKSTGDDVNQESSEPMQIEQPASSSISYTKESKKELLATFSQTLLQVVAERVERGESVDSSTEAESDVPETPESVSADRIRDFYSKQPASLGESQNEAGPSAGDVSRRLKDITKTACDRLLAITELKLMADNLQKILPKFKVALDSMTSHINVPTPPSSAPPTMRSTVPPEPSCSSQSPLEFAQGRSDQMIQHASESDNSADSSDSSRKRLGSTLLRGPTETKKQKSKTEKLPERCPVCGNTMGFSSDEVSTPSSVSASDRGYDPSGDDSSSTEMVADFGVPFDRQETRSGNLEEWKVCDYCGRLTRSTSC